MLSGCIKNHQSLEPDCCQLVNSILIPMQPVQNCKSVQDKKFQVSLLYLNNQNYLSFFSHLFIFSAAIGFHPSHVHFVFLFLHFFQGAQAVLRSKRSDRITESTLEKSPEIIQPVTEQHLASCTMALSLS